MKYRIVHVIDALALGGAERMLVELANASVRDGHDVAVCVTRSNLTLAARLDDRIEILVLDRHRTVEVRALARLVRWSAMRRADIVHCHGQSSFSLAAMLAAGKLVHAPIVFHDHLGVHMGRLAPWWLRTAGRYAAAHVAVDPAQRTWARAAGFASERTHVIGNAIDVDVLGAQRLVGRPLPQDHAQHVVCIGGVRPEKATDVLLEAFSRLTIPAVLHVIGAADNAFAMACRKRAARADLVDRVVFEGVREDALALARTADLAVHASRSESGPLVLAEYTLLGVPFVATQVGAISLALAERQVGTFVKPDDPEALAHALDSMLATPPAQRRDRAREWGPRVRDLYDIRNVMPRWYELYGTIRAEQREGPLQRNAFRR